MAKILHQKLFTPIRNFLTDSRAVGIVLIGCTLFSILLSNINISKVAYTGFWLQETHFPMLSFLHLPETNLLWINDLFMTFFFFLVGMEIKRELIAGELASFKKSLSPILAALGGMICPAVIFSLLNAETPFHHGWGIPMATDIAFSLGILSLLGKRVPVQLKIFLAALAIIDDLGAVVTIALFYSFKIKAFYLLGGLGALSMVVLFNLLKVKKVSLYWIPGVLLWYCLFNSGIHATIAGVLMAFFIPLPKLAALEKKLFYPVNFLVMPLFALANTAIIFPSSFREVYASSISFGVMLGLIFGKPIGIFLFSFIGSKLGFASLPSHTNYKQLWGIGMIGGIGFTMSIFTSSLAYSQDALQVISKVSVISASVIAAVAGYVYLHKIHPAKALSKHSVKPINKTKEVNKLPSDNKEETYAARPALV